MKAICFFLINIIVINSFSESHLPNNSIQISTSIDTSTINLSIQEIFQKKGFQFPTKLIYLRAFKQEQLLELWATDNVQYQLIQTYKFTATSGSLGPKIREGDLQIPEGFYTIDAFNPNSKFHLSFRINYSNFADSIRNKCQLNLGGDIYIHGGNQTVGCIPIGDKNIEELYFICQEMNKNTTIPVHIFPFKMEEKKQTKFYKQHSSQTLFWNSIKPMYRFFQSHKMLGEVTSCDALGNYQLAIPWD